MRLRNSVRSASGTFTWKGRIALGSSLRAVPDATVRVVPPRRNATPEVCPIGFVFIFSIQFGLVLRDRVFGILPPLRHGTLKHDPPIRQLALRVMRDPHESKI